MVKREQCVTSYHIEVRAHVSIIGRGSLLPTPRGHRGDRVLRPFSIRDESYGMSHTDERERERILLIGLVLQPAVTGGRGNPIRFSRVNEMPAGRCLYWPPPSPFPVSRSTSFSNFASRCCLKAFLCAGFNLLMSNSFLRRRLRCFSVGAELEGAGASSPTSAAAPPPSGTVPGPASATLRFFARGCS